MSTDRKLIVGVLAMIFVATCFSSALATTTPQDEWVYLENGLVEINGNITFTTIPQEEWIYLGNGLVNIGGTIFDSFHTPWYVEAPSISAATAELGDNSFDLGVLLAFTSVSVMCFVIANRKRRSA